MTLEDFLNHRWEDGSITQLLFKKDSLTLNIKDWEDKTFEVKFEHVIKLCIDDCFEEDISHISYVEAPEKEISVIIHSAWEGKEILSFKIVLK